MTHQVMKRELAAQPGASGKNICMAAARSNARCYRMLDAAGCSPPLGSPLSVVPQSAPTAPGHLTIASWYGAGFNGQRTSSGETFQENRLTVASRTLPMESQIRVTNLNNGRSVVVRINDRGPYVHGRGIDLSEGARGKIGRAHV